MEQYRNLKTPKDPETWEENINKYVWDFRIIVV